MDLLHVTEPAPATAAYLRDCPAGYQDKRLKLDRHFSGSSPLATCTPRRFRPPDYARAAAMGESLHAWLAGLAAPREGQRIADLGWGAGPCCVSWPGAPAGRRWWASISGPRRCEGPSEPWAERGGGGGLVLADLAEQLPLSSSSFDTVLCHDVLECIPDADGFLEEVA